jgi:aspartate/tyrosine/aromatic aminotransferase
VITSGSVYTIQGLSGTGCLRLGIEFLAQFMPTVPCFYPEVTWPNHPTIVDATRMKGGMYRYLDASGCHLDFNGMMEDFRNFPPKSIVLLHMCAHNPSGVDPSEEQWQEILSVVKERQLFPFFDSAYQGFVSGDPSVDAAPVRLFVKDNIELMVACSFAKNFGLYADRIGALHVVTHPHNIPNIGSQLRVVSRSLYSTCPVHGARIVSIILNDEILKQKWLVECKSMADRLNQVRTSLYEELIHHRVKGTWDHVISQRGMFSYTGIPSTAVTRLKSEFHIYLLDNGRISLAGLNLSNIQYFAASLAVVMGTNE